MNKVYIVTSGEYSDYHIDAVFASREKAEAYVKTKDKAKREEYEHDERDIQTSRYNIEEWTTRDENVDLSYWYIAVEADCSNAFEITNINSVASTENGVEVERWHMRTKITWFSLDAEPYFKLTVVVPKSRFATNQEAEDHCVKAMQDYIAKIKYMVQVDGMSTQKAVDLIDAQLIYNI